MRIIIINTIVNIMYIMKLDNFPKVLWINLDRNPMRRLYMNELLTKHNINHKRIKAIDGSDLSDINKICPNIVNTLHNNVCACTCSHLKALKYFVQKMSDNEIIIFEDDVSFDFLKNIPYDWTKFKSHLPNNYDIIQLSITHDNPVINILNKKTYSSSAAYLITKDAAIKLLSKYNFLKSDTIDFNNNPIAADHMITSLDNKYSISLFTHLNLDSIIHPSHLNYHKKSRKLQTEAWNIILKDIKENGLELYFSKFSR